MKIALLILLAALSGAASALTLTLLPAQQTASPGATVSFFGTILNDGPSAVDLVGNGFTEVSGGFSGFTVGDLDASVPFTLAAGESYTGLVFQVGVPSSATGGDRFGRYAVYGDDGGSAPVFAEATFGIGIASVPGPGPLVSVAAGLGGLALRRRSRHR